MEINTSDINFWKNKNVFITGHSGFKGSWLSLWLSSMGAKVYGYSLEPPTDPSIFNLIGIQDMVEKSYIADIRDYPTLFRYIKEAEPEIVFHLAAQPLVRDSYLIPQDTYSTNVMGTVNILEAIRYVDSVNVFINITTDKVYENKELYWSYRENEPLGGYDPYSSSKACSELVTSAYRSSYFAKKNKIWIASARAGNVIGGGDWAKDRLVPDIIRTFLDNGLLQIRNPKAIRPWQHVLEPLSGYLKLAEKLYISKDFQFTSSFNFGPEDKDVQTVEYIVKKIASLWTSKLNYEIHTDAILHEANYLKLDISKAKHLLEWYPKWNLDIALEKIVEWTLAFKNKASLRDISLKQIQEYKNYR
jgi:CDP-glucose 4,6-dehydratase